MQGCFISNPPQKTRVRTCQFTKNVLNPFMPTVAFNICCPRDCVFRHNGSLGIPLRDDSALRALSTLRSLRGAPAVPPLCREPQSLGQQMLNATVGTNALNLLCTIVSGGPWLGHHDAYCRQTWSLYRIIGKNGFFLEKIVILIMYNSFSPYGIII